MRKMMKQATALILCLVMMLTIVPVQALAADDVTVAKNDFIQVTLNNKNGRFSVRTVDGQPVRKLDQDAPLTFDRDDTSFTTFRINGTEYIFGNKYSIAEKKVQSSMSEPQLIVSDETGTEVISTTWSVEGVDITQELTVFGNTKKTDNVLSGMVMLNYTVNNHSGANVKLGSRVLLDTMIGTNDGPGYQNGTISTNVQTTERTLVRGVKTGDMVDGQEVTIDNFNYYDLQAFFLMRDAGGFEDPLSTNIFAYGYHNFTDSLNLVDKVVVGHWNHLANSKYEVEVDPTLDFTLDTNEYGTADSAVAYFWNDQTLSSGDARQYQILYGLGEIIEENKALNVTFPNPVDHLNATDDRSALENYGVFQVTVQAEVPAELDMYHSYIQCSLRLGSNLYFVKTENGKVYLDADGKPVRTGGSIDQRTTQKQLTPEEIQRRDAEINEKGSSNIGKYAPGDIATFQFYVMAEARAWPAIRSYNAELTSPEIEAAMEQQSSSSTKEKSSAELVAAMDGDPALAAMERIARSASILVPAAGEATKSYSFSLTPEKAYYTDAKIISMGINNIEAYDNSDREVYQVYLINSITNDRFQVDPDAIGKNVLDGKTGLLNFTYWGAKTFNNGSPGEYGETPELPPGAYYVQVLYTGSTDKEVNDMLSFTSTQTITVTTEKLSKLRAGSLVTIAKRYTEADENYKKFINSFNQAAQETADLERFRDSKQYTNGQSVYELLVEGYTYHAGNYRPYYEVRIWNNQAEIDEYKKQINVVEDQTKIKPEDIDENWNHGEVLLTIQGSAQEQAGGIVISVGSSDIIINGLVRCSTELSKGRVDLRIQTTPLIRSFGDRLEEALEKAKEGDPYLWTLDGYNTVTLSAISSQLLNCGNEDDEFFTGDWRIDFFDGFDKSLWTQLMDNFVDRTAEEMLKKEPSSTVVSHANGIVADQEIPCGMIWDPDVYINKVRYVKKSQYDLLTHGGINYQITEHVFAEKNNEPLLRMSGKCNFVVFTSDAENIAYDKAEFWGEETNIVFDVWRLLGCMFGGYTRDAINWFSGGKVSPLSGTVRSATLGIAKDVGFTAESKVLIQRSKAKTDYYFAGIVLNLLGMFEVEVQIGVKRARDGKLKPDRIMASLDFDPGSTGSSLPWKDYSLPKGEKKAEVLGNGVPVGPNTYLSAFRFTVTDLADSITGDTTFPVISAGVNITIPLDDPTGMTSKIADNKVGRLIVDKGSKFRLLGTVDMTAKSTGFSVDGTLRLGAMKLINEAYVKVQWADPWSFQAKVTIDVMDFHVLIGSGSLGVGKGLLEGSLMVAAYIPKFIPVIGGLALAKFEVGFNKEKIWGSVAILLVLVPLEISVTYYFGSGDVDFSFFETESLEDKPEDGNLWYVLYTDEESGEQGMMGIGSNLRCVASSPPTIRDQQDVIYRDLGGGVQFLEFRANNIGPSDITVTENYNATTGEVDSWTHSIPVGKAKGDSPADALLQVESFDNSGKDPSLSIRINGKDYALVWGEASGDAKAPQDPAPDTIYGIRQKLEDNGTTQQRSYLAIPYEILNSVPADAALELTSDQPIDTALIRAAKTLKVNDITVTPDSANPDKLNVTTTFQYAKAGDTLALRITEDNTMPEAGGAPDEEVDKKDMADMGVLIHEGQLTAEEAAAGFATRTIDLTKCSVPVAEGVDEVIEEERDVRQMMASGTYYMRANMSSSASYQSVISPTPIQITDPLSPMYNASDMNVRLEPAGNGRFAVTFPKVEKKDRNGDPVERINYAVDFYQNGEIYDPFSGVFFDPDEENPNMTYNAGSNTYTVILGERFNTENVQVDDEGNVVGQTASHIGLDTGKRYQASVRVSTVVENENSDQPSYHMGQEAMSNESFLPEPTPPQLTISGAEHVTQYVNADGSVDDVDYYELLTKEDAPSVSITSDVDATVDIVTDEGEEVEMGVSLKAGAAHTVDLSQFTENGQVCVVMTTQNDKTKDTSDTTLYLTVDHIAPSLILDGSPEEVYNASYKDGVMKFSGTTSHNAILRAYLGDSTEAITGTDLFTFEDDGVSFTANIPVSKEEPQATIRITATDRAGNETAASLTMRNADYEVVRGVSLNEIENLTLPLNPEGDVKTDLHTELVYHSGKRVPLETEDVEYSIYLGNSVTLDDKAGTVTAVRDGMSIIRAAYTASNGMQYEDLMTVRVLSETTEAIRVVPPAKQAYVVGEELDLTGGEVIILNEDGTDGDSIPLTADMITGFDSSTPGAQTLYVTYGGAQDSFPVTVSETAGEWVLSGIEVKPPVKTRYLTGDSLNLDGAALTMTYRLGAESKEETTALDEIEDAEITGFDNSKAGYQILTVTYQGQSAQFRVEVLEKALTSVKVDTLPEKTMYLVNKDDLDLTGGQLTLIYNEDDEGATETATLDLTDEAITVTGYDKTKIGAQILTVTYEGKSDTENLVVMVNDRTLDSIQLKGTPKSEYLEEEALDVSGVSVTLVYDNGTEEDISLTEGMISGYDATKPGEQTLTVTYNGKTTEYTVTVQGRTLTNLELVSGPYKTKYPQDAALNWNGTELRLTYDNGTVRTLTPSAGQFDEEVTVSGYDPTQSGKQTVTLSVGGQSVTVEVEVEGKKLLSASMEALPEKLAYKFGEALNLTGGRLSLYYDNNTTEKKELTEDMVSGYNPSKPGVQTLTVSYGNSSVTFNITVSDKALTGIELTKSPEKLEYFTGEELDVTGGEITLIYEDGSREGPITLTDAMVSGFHSASAGTRTLTITYDEMTTTYSVTVSVKAVTEVTVKTLPTKTDYKTGDTLNLTGGEVTLTYNDGSTEVVPMTEDMVSGGLELTGDPGQTTIHLSVSGVEAEFDVNVTEAEKLPSYALDVNPDGSYSVTVNDDSIPRGILVVTKYDADGRMLAIRSLPIQLTKGTQSGVLDEMKDTDANYTVSLLTSSYISLCDKAEIINVTPN